MSEVAFDDNKRAGWWRFVPMAVFAVVMLGGFVVTLISLQRAPADTWQGMGLGSRWQKGSQPDASRQR